MWEGGGESHDTSRASAAFQGRELMTSNITLRQVDRAGAHSYGGREFIHPSVTTEKTRFLWAACTWNVAECTEDTLLEGICAIPSK